MTKKLEYDQLSADLASVDSILENIPEDDVLGRIGFEARKHDLELQLRDLEAHEEHRAAVALFFGGEPVRGSLGIKSEFAGEALGRFQDMVAKILAQRQIGNLGQRGIVPHREQATLHLTGVVHGSFGLVLQELQDEPQDPLLATELKLATEEAARLVSIFADEDDDRFTAALVDSDPRIVNAVGKFVDFIGDNSASVRLVSNEIDRAFSAELIVHAAERFRITQIEEIDVELKGELLGLLPEAHRFEFREAPIGRIIDGAVAPEIASAELQEWFRRLGFRRCRARMHVRKVERPGKPFRESYTLLGVEADG